MHAWFGKIKRGWWVGMALALVIIVLPTGCQTKGKEVQPPPGTAVIIRPGDALTIMSVDAKEVYDFRVPSDGTIKIPFLGKFVVAGKTMRQLQLELIDRDPQHRIFSIRPDTGLTYYVMGAVRSPGPKRYLAKMRVSDVIDSSGGFTKNADTKRIKLIHPSGSRKTVRFQKDATDEAHNPEFFPGDTLIVERLR